MRRSALLLSVAVLGAVVAGILLVSRVRDDPGRSPDSPSFPMTFKDDEGVTVTVSEAPKRIVVVAPHLTEFLFVAGAGTRVVGATGTEEIPPEATVLPSVVGPDGVTPDATKIQELRPDLVLASGFQQAQWKQQLAAAGVTLVSLHPTGVDDAIADMRRAGELVGATDGASVVRRMTEEVERLVERVGSRRGPRVFVEALFPPLTGVGPAGFTGDLVEHAGGVLVAPDGAAEVFAWSTSNLGQADPDLYLAPRSSARDEESIGSRPGFSEVRVVKEKAVHVLPDHVLFSPGPRLAQALKTLAELFHPGLE